MAESDGTVRLTEQDMAFILSILRTWSSPATTATLVAELRSQAAR